MKGRPSRLIRFSVSVVAACAATVGRFVLGMLTGIYGMCSNASNLWAGIYLAAGVSIVPCSVLAGYLFSRRLSRLR